MSAIADGAKKENRNVTDDERKEFDELEAEIVRVKADIARAERLEAEKAERAKPTTEAVSVVVTRDADENEKGELTIWRSFGEQLQAVAAIERSPHSAQTRELRDRLDRTNKAMRAASGANESVLADGGALVQKDFASEILDKAYLAAPFASRVQKYGLTTKANGIKLPYIDESSRADGSRQGGIQAYWEEEAAQYTASKTKVGLMELNTKKLIGAAYITDELLEDAGVLGQWVTNGFKREFAFKLDDAFLNGNGAGKPRGILKCEALVTQAKETSQTAVTLNAQNVAKMYARLFEPNLPTAIWLYNQGVKQQLMTLSLTVGSNTYPVMIPGGISGNFAGAVPVTSILGQPAFASEHCEALGTVGDILIADPTAYIAIDKGGMKQAQSVHVRFLYDEMTYKFTYRVDGQPAWKTALTPYKGSDTLSPYVTLATRA
jgi:HK97 family phage major capsid protein